MQTFLPYSDFVKSARILDRARLGKQRVECFQLLCVNLGLKKIRNNGIASLIEHEAKGWKNHPAALMWKGWESGLLSYMEECNIEWKNRGYNGVESEWNFSAIRDRITPSSEKIPAWYGRESFHRAHQSNLIRKMPEYYGPLFPNVPNNLEYEWR
jgi:hypothetical protein